MSVLASSSSWAKEQDAESIRAFIRSRRLFPEKAGSSEPALLQRLAAGRLLNVFEGVAIDEGTAIFEFADLRGNVTAGPVAREISLFGPVKENGAGMALRFVVNDSAPRAHHFSAMIPSLCASANVAVEPMLVVFSLDGRIMRLAKVEAATGSVNAVESSYEPAPNSKVASLSIKLGKGKYFAQAFLVGSGRAKSALAISIVK